MKFLEHFLNSLRAAHQLTGAVLIFFSYSFYAIVYQVLRGHFGLGAGTIAINIFYYSKECYFYGQKEFNSRNFRPNAKSALSNSLNAGTGSYFDTDNIPKSP
ncbi:MAG: hypothetical protein SPL86_12690 [Succiniclasticum sp.]|uniref:hypothetical protein n=1 Tax=Succiniclasticum sp. TaxID=2775030 RepID=UPI002A917B0F|nr:hypothetical protein [Succiniclasticum sp.]MDY6292325.1 hypothetical protein [Succiniclasticum sp.]